MWWFQSRIARWVVVFAAGFWATVTFWWFLFSFAEAVRFLLAAAASALVRSCWSLVGFFIFESKMAGSGCYSLVISSDDIGGSIGVEFEVLLTSFFSLFSSSDTWFSNAPKLMKSMNFQIRVPRNLFSELVYNKVSSSGISLPIKFLWRIIFVLSFSPCYDPIPIWANFTFASAFYYSSIIPPSLSLCSDFDWFPPERYL